MILNQNNNNNEKFDGHYLCMIHFVGMTWLHLLTFFILNYFFSGWFALPSESSVYESMTTLYANIRC